MGNCTAVPSFRRTHRGSRSDANRSTLPSATDGTLPPLQKRETYVVRCNQSSPSESRLLTAIKNRRKRASQTNCIKTTRYNIITFIPKNLFEQFHRVANIYFVILIGLNWVPAINALSKNVMLFSASLPESLASDF